MAFYLTSYPRTSRLNSGFFSVLMVVRVVLNDATAWAAYLRRNLVDSARAVALATEGALIGGLATQEFNLDIGFVSDDAGQFDLFVHGLCWVHAERPLQHLLPLHKTDRRAITWVRQQIWHLYRDLKAYRQQPTEAANTRITADFEAICTTETTCEPLNHVLGGLHRNQFRDRGSGLNVVPRLADFIRQAAAS